MAGQGGKMEVGIIEDATERLFKINQSMENHKLELAIIEKKIDNPHVPDGKKDKLIFRYHIITKQVIPKLNSTLRRYL